MTWLFSLLRDFWMLAALPVVAAPVIIHLLNRTRFKRTRFAAMEFLLRALERTRKRLRFENLLILILRCLLLLLIVMAFAYPTFDVKLEESSARPTHYVILIDNSKSLAYQTTDHTVFEALQKKAGELVDRLSNGRDAVSVLLMWPVEGVSFASAFGEDSAEKESSAKAFFSRDLRGEVQKYIGQTIEPVNRETEYLTLLSNAVELLEKEKDNPFYDIRRTILLTDCQKSGFDSRETEQGTFKNLLARIEELTSFPLMVIDVAPEGELKNLCIDRIEIDSVVVVTGISPKIDIYVTNHSPEEVSGVSLSLRIGKEVYRVDAPPLPPHVQVAVPYTKWVPEESGPQRLQAQIDSPDGLLIDNTRFHSLEVRDGIKVLVLDGDPGDPGESFNFQVACETTLLNDSRGTPGAMALPPVETTIVGSQEFTGEMLDDYDIVAMLNVSDMSAPNLAMLTNFVASGGGLLISLGDRLYDNFYNEQLYNEGKGLLPGMVAPRVTIDTTERSGLSIGASPTIDPESAPVLERFALTRGGFDLLFSPETGVTVWDYFPLILDPALLKDGSTTTIIEVGYPVDMASEKDRAVFELIAQMNKSTVELVSAEVKDFRLDPFFCERKFEKGTVLVFTSPLDWQGNSLYRTPSYVPVVLESVYHLAGAGDAWQNLFVGGQYRRSIPFEEYAENVTLTHIGETGEDLRKKIHLLPVFAREGDQEPERFSLEFSDTGYPGFYNIDFTTDEEISSEFFTVNFNTVESDLSKLGTDFDPQTGEVKVKPTEEAMKEMFGSSIVYSRAGISDADDIAVPRSSTLWWWLLVFALALLLLETVLASVFGRASQKSSVVHATEMR
ncbi:MAG: BatA domain-containing protein [Planctomycetes bacterium]|nr:BatA domain-containing protein [Planctomycetota bacterium]